MCRRLASLTTHGVRRRATEKLRHDFPRRLFSGWRFDTLCRLRPTMSLFCSNCETKQWNILIVIIFCIIFTSIFHNLTVLKLWIHLTHENYRSASTLSNVVVICGHITISVLCGNTAYCVKLSDEDWSRYSNEIESVGLRKCPYYHCLIIRKWYHNNIHFSQLAHTKAGKQLA